jgi:hypothetical protein
VLDLVFGLLRCSSILATSNPTTLGLPSVPSTTELPLRANEIVSLRSDLNRGLMGTLVGEGGLLRRPRARSIRLPGIHFSFPLSVLAVRFE